MSRSRLPALLLIAALLGCADGSGAGPDSDPSALRPIIHLQTDSPEIVAEALAAIRKSGVTAEFRAIAEVPHEERGFWTEKTSGWLLFVRVDQIERGMAAYDRWSDGLSSVAEPAPVPAMELGAPTELEPKRVASIRQELARRRKRDQAVRREPKRHGEMASVDEGNTAWLVDLVREIGWIDVERFGAEAATAAFLLVQHSGNIALMKAALPGIEKDVRKGRLDGQAYALLYDRLALTTGGRQRYGTQIVVRASGRQVVEHLEDPERVDARRKAIGLGPLADYLDGFDGEIVIER